jgi:hypothetical protein
MFLRTSCSLLLLIVLVATSSSVDSNSLLHVVAYDSDNLFALDTQECLWVFGFGPLGNRSDFCLSMSSIENIFQKMSIGRSLFTILI